MTTDYNFAANAILMVHRRLRAAGWEQQTIAGLPAALWRHPFKAHGSEVTTMQACQIEEREPGVSA